MDWQQAPGGLFAASARTLNLAHEGSRDGEEGMEGVAQVGGGLGKATNRTGMGNRRKRGRALRHTLPHTCMCTSGAHF